MAGISKEKRQAIRDLRNFGFSKSKTSEVVGVSTDTVRKYEPEDDPDYDPEMDPSFENAAAALSDEIDPFDVFHDDFIPDDESDADEDEYTGTPPGQSPIKDEATRDLRLRDDYSSLDPGEFITQFFDDFDVGVRSKVVTIISRRSKRKNKIPDEDKMRSLLLELPSGISNSEEARFVAEEYWAEAQEYRGDTDVRTFGGDAGGRASDAPRGEWTGPQGQGNQEGEWVQIPGRGWVYGTFVQTPNGGRRFEEMQPPQQPGMQPQGMQQGGMMGGPGVQAGYGQRDRVDRLEEKVDEKFDKLAENLQNDPFEGLKQGLQFKKEMDDLMGDEDPQARDRIMEQVNQQIAALRNELSGQNQAPQGGSPSESLFRRALQDESVDHETLMQLADRMEGEADPEVRKKEIEMEMEREKMKRKKETTERVMGSLENVVERFGAGLGAAISGSGEPTETETTAGEPEPQQQQQQPQQQAQQAQVTQQAQQQADGGSSPTEEWECPHCGELTEIDPRSPGVSCDNCDFSRVPCPDCQRPLGIPPEDEAERAGCPECDNMVPLPEDLEGQAACIADGCGWVGPVEEVLGDTVECENCGSENPIIAEPEIPR